MKTAKEPRARRARRDNECAIAPARALTEGPRPTGTSVALKFALLRNYPSWKSRRKAQPETMPHAFHLRCNYYR